MDSAARQDNYADSGSACKLAGVQIIPLPTLANQILARTFFRSVANSLASPAVGKFSRASSAGGVGNAAHDGVPAIVMAIHTFGEYLDFHPHLHALVADKI